MKLSIFCCLLGILLIVGCKGTSNGHGHGHGHGQAEHAHELPSESATIWTDKAELFMEWDPLIVGHSSRFLAHISDMSNPNAFKAVPEAEVVVAVTVGYMPFIGKVDKPARLGIFIPELTPTKAGQCVMTVSLKSSSLTETFTVSPCTVYADATSALAAVDDSEPTGQIGFLKEQQWPIDFATAAAKMQEVIPSKSVNAKILAVPEREARLTAGTTGRVSLQPDAPTLGDEVKKGQVLARIQPIVTVSGSAGTLHADVSAAQAEHTAARTAHTRLAGLAKSGAVPQSRLEEAQSALQVTKAQLNAAKIRLASYQASASGDGRAGAFLVKSPIAGTLVERSVTHGETVTAGKTLFSVIDLDRVRVEGRVFETDLPAFEKSSRAWFTVPGRETTFEIDENTGALITVGHVLDPKSRTAPVVFEVENPNRVLRIGQFAKLSVGTGPPIQALVIPESAVIQDGNQQVVFVHKSGESFERRIVTLGTSSRGLVAVPTGIAKGERVVTVGAYDVKLAASAGDAPAHGHAH